MLPYIAYMDPMGEVKQKGLKKNYYASVKFCVWHILAPHISDLKLHPKLDGLIGNMRIHFVTPKWYRKMVLQMVPPSLKLIYKPIHLSNALNI